MLFLFVFFNFKGQALAVSLLAALSVLTTPNINAMHLSSTFALCSMKAPAPHPTVQ